MKYFLLLIATIAVGCQSKASSSTAVTNPSATNVISTTKEWLGKFPDFAEYDTRGFIRELSVPLDQFIENWLNEGRKIDGLSDALVNILQAPTPPARAIFAAGKLRIKECAPCLVQHLNDERAWYRIYSATSLGDLEDPIAVPKLGSLAINDPDKNVRANCVGSLIKIGTTESLAFLERAVNDKSKFVADYAKDGIEQIRSARGK